MKTINIKIKVLRLKLKITQAELALKIGIPQSTISKWENGKREPSINQLITLAKFFKCTTDYLLGLE